MEQYRGDLRRVVRVRLDDQLIRRLDPSDVIQEVFLKAAPQVEKWLEEEKSVYACLYQLTRRHLDRIHRDHLQRERRSVAKERANVDLPDDSIADLAARLIDGGSSP